MWHFEDENTEEDRTARQTQLPRLGTQRTVRPRGVFVQVFKSPGISSSCDKPETRPEVTHLGQKWMKTPPGLVISSQSLRLQPGARSRPAALQMKSYEDPGPCTFCPAPSNPAPAPQAHLVSSLSPWVTPHWDLSLTTQHEFLKIFYLF